MANQSKFATVEQDSPSRPPILTAGDVTPAVMRSFEMACFGYFEHKDITEDKQVRKILAGMQDTRIQDWISVDRDHFLGLSFANFMTEFHAGYLPEDWEAITHIELLAMTQGDATFWDFAIHVQAKNSLLRDTDSHLPEDKLRHRIESGMSQKLALRCRLDKTTAIKDFKQWLNESKRVDDLVRAERADFEALTKTTRDSYRRNNTFAELSRRANTTSASAPATSAFSASRISLPKLTQTERTLLFDNEGCLKCCRVFVNHQSTACTNGFPDASTYKPLTQDLVDLFKKRAKKGVASVMTANNDTNASTQPIAVVMGTSANPVAYMPANASNVVEGDSLDSDSSVVSPSPIAHITQQNLSPTLKASVDDIAPLTVPHLFWQCSTSGPVNCPPVTISALIDHGAHVVLISDDLATSLDLKRRQLHKQLPVEMAIPGSGAKHVVQLTEWVKLSLYDVSNLWSSKTVRAVIAPSLCAPVILGLPFLSHNNIVIDHAARTAIDKTTGFDLLNPPPVPTPKARKPRLKEFFLQLKEDRALMLAELKLVCHEHYLINRRHFEDVRPPEPVAAMRQRIEQLTAIEQLNRLSDAVKTKYSDVFEAIPHLNELPSDVYCRIKLKDATKTITSRSYATPRKYKEAWSTLI